MTIRNMIHELIPQFEIDSMLDNASVSVVRYQDGLYHLKPLTRQTTLPVKKSMTKKQILIMRIFLNHSKLNGECIRKFTLSALAIF